MKPFRWQPAYVVLHIVFHYLFVVIGLVELASNGTFFTFPLGVANVLTLMAFKDGSGGQLLSAKYLKNYGLIYYYPRSRIMVVSDRLWFSEVQATKEYGPPAKKKSALREKTRWQVLYVRFVWGFLLIGNGLAVLEIATLRTCFMFILIVPNLLQWVLLKDREGKMLFHPRNLREGFGLSWIPLKSEEMVSDRLFR